MISGLDVSLNHGAAVKLDKKGDHADHRFFTTTAGVVARSKGKGERLILPKTKDGQLLKMARLAWVRDWVERTLVEFAPEFVGIEDYALRAEQGAHQLGEAGGAARLVFWNSGVCFRLHDPISVKMFATHDGTAQKDSVEEAVLERWNMDFGHYNNPQTGKKQDRTTSEDLADAMAVAKLLHVEVELRAGRLLMSQLHPKEIQVFNRVTKTYPISLLGREWLQNPAGPGTHGAVAKRLQKAIDTANRRGADGLARFLTKVLSGGK